MSKKALLTWWRNPGVTRPRDGANGEPGDFERRGAPLGPSWMDDSEALVAERDFQGERKGIEWSSGENVIKKG